MKNNSSFFLSSGTEFSAALQMVFGTRLCAYLSKRKYVSLSFRQLSICASVSDVKGIALEEAVETRQPGYTQKSVHVRKRRVCSDDR